MHSGLYVVMGVAGAGKSLIGSAFARAVDVPFVEGDAWHPAANIERMARGIPLTDADRAGWLEALAARIAEAARDGTGVVVACSALKRAYRDVLRGGAPDRFVQFILLHGDRELIAERLAGRSGHFMPPSLLDSQFATLELPAPDEAVWVCDVAQTPEQIVATVVGRARRVA